ncbi:Arogenate dehydrogenase [Salinivirga cyanobacteriivorans]|uniref:Arogenate dehydrogenase n=1 Tax=Salinivirga cyanobacteriivorans TaxID=1307839 RepID=A0A0S2I295_9BACT|nr:prephenate dehydrogenase [Salinivirga cyanobacteriivorans]ALO16368.1 Arogenate dehydrogenase [Salinivirga cyanobacteriivorans]
MIVTVIGLGLIGSSMAIDLKSRGFAQTIIGIDSNAIHAEAALQLGIVDKIMEMQEGIAQADLILLATPVDVSLKILPKVLDQIDEQIVADVCSTKGKLNERVYYHKKRENFVSTHPMAGTEHSGPRAAFSGLFDGRATIITDAEDSSDKALQTIKTMYECLNMRIIYMNAYNHDVHAAYISHISHISSMALALTVLEKEKNEKNILDLASGGFDSTVRLAKSPASMWAPIFMENSENVATVLDTYIEHLQTFKKAITDQDSTNITELINQSNKIKRVLNR